MIGTAALVMIWDATLGRLFGRRRASRFYSGEEVVVQGRLIRSNRSLDDRAFLCLSLSDGIAVAGDRLGLYRREAVPCLGELAEVRLRDLCLKGVPLGWQALRLPDDDARYLACDQEDAKLVKAAGARRRVE